MNALRVHRRWLEVLLLSEVFADSWDEVAQETRTQLERNQEWRGHDWG